MKLEEAIQFKKTDESEDLEEGIIGDAVRGIAAGTGLFYGIQLAASAIVAAFGLSLTPFVIGAGGAVAVSYGIKKAFDMANEIESRQLMRMVDKLAETINERDMLLASYYEEDTTRKEKRKIKKKVDRITERQKRLGQSIIRFFDNNIDQIEDILTYEDIRDVEAIIEAAKNGRLTTLKVN